MKKDFNISPLGQGWSDLDELRLSVYKGSFIDSFFKLLDSYKEKDKRLDSSFSKVGKFLAKNLSVNKQTDFLRSLKNFYPGYFKNVVGKVYENNRTSGNGFDLSGIWDDNVESLVSKERKRWKYLWEELCISRYRDKDEILSGLKTLLSLGFNPDKIVKYMIGEQCSHWCFLAIKQPEIFKQLLPVLTTQFNIKVNDEWFLRFMVQMLDIPDIVKLIEITEPYGLDPNMPITPDGKRMWHILAEEQPGHFFNSLECLKSDCCGNSMGIFDFNGDTPVSILLKNLPGKAEEILFTLDRFNIRFALDSYPATEIGL